MAEIATMTHRVTLPVQASAILTRRAKMGKTSISNVILSLINESDDSSHSQKITDEQKELEETIKKQAKATEEFLAFARANPVFEKGYKFNREECYDRKIFR